MKAPATLILTLASLLGSTSETTAKEFKRTLKEGVVVSNREGKLYITWDKPGTYQVFQGDHPETIQWKDPLMVTNRKEITVEATQERLYFGIVDEKHDTLIVSERKLPFVHADNFRDLGGIQTKDGRFVAWGRFYRSDALDKLDDQEFTLFEQLGITKVYDLRSNEEVAKNPDDLPQGTDYIHWPIFNLVNSSFFTEIEKKVAEGTFTVQDAEKLLVDANVDFAGKYHAEFKGLLASIFSANTPLVFHCSSGKDRTGFTAAMLLAILNVDRATIFEEYEMTNFYIQQDMAKIVEGMSKALNVDNKTLKSAMYALMGVKREYLASAFDVIDKQYGGIDAYIKNQLGISDEEREKLIKQFTYQQ